jgi:hypothetical protein
MAVGPSNTNRNTSKSNNKSSWVEGHRSVTDPTTGITRIETFLKPPVLPPLNFSNNFGLPAPTPKLDEKVINRKYLKGQKEYPTAVGKATPAGVEFNLPPHEWSLPLNPSNLDKLPDVTAAHARRRGKMWLYSDFVGVQESTTSNTKKPNTNIEGGRSGTGQSSTNRENVLANTAKLTGGPQAATAPAFYKPAGFQFLWNPQEIQLQVATKMDIVPDAGDRFRAVAGIFPSQEHLTFSLMIDRTNDFAAIYRSYIKNQNNPNILGEIYKSYYKEGLNSNIGTPYAKKLKNLMEYGTMHDIEYIFKMINAGTLLEDKQPVNPLGRETYDLGYLYPALTAIEFGPSSSSLKPLSYVGWLQSVSMKHTAFNTNMIPLRTELAFDVWIYTGFGLENKE